MIVIIVCVTVGILKLIDRQREKQAARRQLLIEHNAALPYATMPQRNPQPVYNNERMEMVPDILESSLPRPHHTQYAPTYAPESESSYGTNYPGTMYFMGTQNRQAEPMKDYDCVTLPKKPETVSDSESEDLYAVIPPY